MARFSSSKSSIFGASFSRVFWMRERAIVMAEVFVDFLVRAST